LDEASAAGDLAGIFAFMKSLDPASTVRESEFENASNTLGLVEKRKTIYNKIFN
jgi:hypothetical protein